EGDRERGKVGDQGDCGGRGRRRPPLSLSGASTHGGAAGRAVDGGWRSALYAGAVSGGGRAGEGREQEEGGNGGRGGGRSCDCRSPFPPLPASVPVASRLSVALVAAYRLLTVRRGGRWTVTPGVDGGAQERVVGGGRRRYGAGVATRERVVDGGTVVLVGRGEAAAAATTVAEATHEVLRAHRRAQRHSGHGHRRRSDCIAVGHLCAGPLRLVPRLRHPRRRPLLQRHLLQRRRRVQALPPRRLRGPAALT
ncbi:hypothetical protein EE612_047251, partial [Oryza sativa]